MALKDTELKEFVSYLGINPDEIESIDKAKEAFSGNYIIKSALKDSDEFKKSVGGAFGNITTVVKRVAKEHGIELTSDDIKDKKVEEIISVFDAKLKETYTARINEEREKAAAKPSEREKEWEDKYGKLKQKHDEKEQMIQSLTGEVEKVKQSSKQELNHFRIMDASERALSGIKFTEDVKKDALKLTGFKAHLESKYLRDIDEDGTPFIMDKATKSRIPNPKKMGAFLSIDEVYALEAEQNNLVEKVGEKQKNSIFVKAPVVIDPNAHQQTGDKRRTLYSERNPKK